VQLLNCELNKMYLGHFKILASKIKKKKYLCNVIEEPTRGGWQRGMCAWELRVTCFSTAGCMQKPGAPVPFARAEGSGRTGVPAAVTCCLPVAGREQCMGGALFPKTCSCVTGFFHLSAQDICGFCFISGRCLFRPAGSWCVFLTRAP